jgi:hypothetical protein
MPNGTLVLGSPDLGQRRACSFGRADHVRRADGGRVPVISEVREQPQMLEYYVENGLLWVPNIRS